MNRTLKTLLAFAITFLFTCPASADPVSPLQACMSACQSKLEICFSPDQTDISQLCVGVTECQPPNLSTTDIATASTLLKLCITGQAQHCPTNCPSGGTATPPPKKTGGGTTTPPRRRNLTPEEQCHQRRGYWVVKDQMSGGPLCFTNQYAHERIDVLNFHQVQLNDRVAALEELKQLLASAVIVEPQYAAVIRQMIAEYPAMKAQVEQNTNRISGLTGVAYNHEGRLQRLEGGQVPVGGTVLQPGQPVPPTQRVAVQADEHQLSALLPGISIGPYVTGQAYKLYDKSGGGPLYAVGGEAQVSWGISTNGRWRLAGMYGLGYGNTYFDKHLTQMHYGAGVMYQGLFGWDPLSLTTMVSHVRYDASDTDHKRMGWTGVTLEPRLTAFQSREPGDAEKGGHGFFFFVRAGAGQTKGVHGLDLGEREEPVKKFDIPMAAGLGYTWLSFY
ncbi:MAG: hypothetical protein ACOYUZ_00005 [Patescibacteria group bacterium]